MSSRSIAILIAAIASLGGVIVLANPVSLIAQQSTSQPSLTQAPAERPMRDKAGWLHELNLTQQQMQQIQAIRNQYKDQLTGQRQAMRQAHQELHNLMAGDASPDQIRQQYNQVKELKQKLADAQFESMLAMREVLTPEQRRNVSQQMQRHRGRFHQRMHDRLQQRGPGAI